MEFVRRSEPLQFSDWKILLALVEEELDLFAVRQEPAIFVHLVFDLHANSNHAMSVDFSANGSDLAS